MTCGSLSLSEHAHQSAKTKQDLKSLQPSNKRKHQVEELIKKMKKKDSSPD